MDDLKYIKKHYGENFAHLCRSLFPTILQTDGLLSKIISQSFVPSRELYYSVIDCIPEFQEYIYSFMAIKETRKIQKENVLTPEELFDKAGYILYPECQTEEEIHSFKKYYAKNEELCTFDRNRLETCRVWFAVKKNVDEIRREDFLEPERQDEYGTSVISIQFTKSNLNTLSIKNRYNHMVKDPDATFKNDLDNIIEGLTDSFIVHYGLNLIDGKMASFELKGFARANDGKYYKRNIFVHNIDYCENNVVIDHGKLMVFDTSKYLLIDNYLIDFANRKIALYPPRSLDSFSQSIGKIKKIMVKKDENENKIIEVTPMEGKIVTIIANKKNQMISYRNENVTNIGSYFLNGNRTLRNLDLPNVVTVGGEFLFTNQDLVSLNMPKLETAGRYFLASNEELKSLYAPNLKKIGKCFLNHNNKIEEINVPKLVDKEGYLPMLPNLKVTKYDVCENKIHKEKNKEENIYCNDNSEGYQEL